MHKNVCCLLAGIGFVFVMNTAVTAGEDMRTVPLAGLDSVEDIGRLETRNAKVEWIRPGAVRVEYGVADWPTVVFMAKKAYDREDWREFGGLALDVRNIDPKPVSVCVRVDDDPKADGRVHCRTGRAELAPGEHVTLVVSIEDPPGMMRAGPPAHSAPGARFMNMYGVPLDRSHIIAAQVFLHKPTVPQKIEIANLRLVAKDRLDGIVDRFGQYARADWPGKLSEEGEFAQRLEQEEDWLRRNPVPSDRDEFGGWKDGPEVRATGFFRTALVAQGMEVAEYRAGARWWLVTPTGRLFWSVGITCVRPRSEGPIQGNEFMFTWLPEDSRKSKWADFYQTNLRRKYGEGRERQWTDMTCRRLLAWGFNTIGNWSDPCVFRARRVPYTVPLQSGGKLPYISAEEYRHKPGAHRRLPDFFDPRFPQSVDGAVAKGTAEWKDDPWCVGFFVDNELAWDSWAQMGKGGEYLTAREALGAPASLAARQVLVGQLQRKYESVAALNAAWGIKASSWDEPIHVGVAQLNQASREDCSVFMSALAERYFSTVSAALRRHAPKHLYLGCRFAIRPAEVVRVAAKYCDVVSFNIYSRTVDAQDWAFTQGLGKPVMIGEFHFGATDRGMFHPGLGPTRDQVERASAYQEYVRSVLALPAFVGCHWFQYVDQPLTGRFDGENYNIGFVTITDTPYPELRAAARETNAEIYGALSSR